MSVTNTDNEGTEGRFRALYDRHYSAVLGYVLRRIGNRADSEEIVNSVFRIAWQRLDRVPEEPNTRQWLLWVARRTIGNHLRSSQRWTKLIQRIASFRLNEVAPAHLAELDADDLPIRRAFDRLRPGEQEVLRLVLWDQLSHSEAARLMRCSVNTFDVRLHRARSALRTALEAETADAPSDEETSHPARATVVDTEVDDV